MSLSKPTISLIQLGKGGGGAFFRIWAVFRQEMENCNRSFVSSPFLDKTMVKEGRGRRNIAFSCYIEGLGAGRGSSMFSSTTIGCKFFCVCFAVCTSVGVKWHREAAVRYHAKSGPAGTP